MKVIEKEKQIEHPLEELFDIEAGTTLVEYHEILPEKPIEMPNYDKKDDEIEHKLEEIYAVAMGQVSIMGDAMETVEGKYKARVGEVTSNMLNVALGAVREKRMMKEHKDKITTTKGSNILPNNVTNNNLIVADRNELLKMVRDKKRMEEGE